MQFPALLLALLVSLPGDALADGIDDFKGGWTGRALAAQRLLDLETPLRDVNMIGAHNAFNSDAYASLIRYLDPNQTYSIFDLLRMGARSIEFDVHWTSKAEGPISFPDRLVLCHGTAGHVGCSLDDRYFTEGLEEISAWLGTADSIDQVVLLHIEDHMEGQHGEAFQQIDSRIGSHVYFSGGCSDVPGGLTKADVLAAGKRVVVWNEGACSGDGSWNSMVFTGLGGIDRIWEDTTTFSGDATPPIGAGEVRDFFASGVNVIDLDQLQENDDRWAAAVWSWDLGEPNDVGNEDCAVQIANGRWNDADCNQERIFACENVLTGGWAVSGVRGPFGIGSLACSDLGAEYRFSVPTNSQDNQLLNDARIQSGHDTAWLNYDDRAVEGVWARNDTEDVFFGAGAFRLGPGQSLYGKSRMLRMEPNCNLVLYSLAGDVVGAGLWTSRTAGAGGACHVDFQSDGNLVIYDGGGGPRWSSSTSGAELRLQSDGNLVIYDGAGRSLWSTFTGYPPDLVVDAGRLTMTSGQILHSANRRLILRDDCELELFSFENGVVGGVVWRSGTAGAGTGCHADFQDDGNFVLYDGAGDYHWASGTSGTTGAQLRMQSDGNVVIYNGAGEPLWSTFTNPREQAFVEAGRFRLDAGQFLQTRNRKLEMRDDCELVLSSVDNAVVGGLLWRSGTSNAGSGCYVDFQDDGNFVLYDDGRAAHWASGTSGTVGAQLRLQRDGNLVVYNGAGEPLWTSHTRLPTESSFEAGQLTLAPGQFIRLENRLLQFDGECNLALYELENALPGLRLWQTDTGGDGSGCLLDFQPDGNLVLYDGGGQARWASGTSGTTGARFRIQADGNMVVYNGAGEALWTSQTPGNFSDVAQCGDATCNGDESCVSCPVDCGACPPTCECGNGLIEAGCGEQCDDGNARDGDCCSSSCRIEAPGTTCRAAAGGCDVAEVCDGATAYCPEDVKESGGTVCREAVGACDVPEVCDGSSNDCPAAERASVGAACGDVDLEIAGQKLLVRDLEALGRGGRVVFAAKDAGIEIGAGVDPGAIEARLEIRYPGTGPRGSFTLPAGAFDGTSGWQLGSAVQYLNREAPGGDSGVKTAILKPGKTLKLSASSTGDEALDLAGAGAPEGPVDVVFTVRNGAETMRHCTSFPSCRYTSGPGGLTAALKCSGGRRAPCPASESFQRITKARRPEHLFVIPVSAMTDAEATLIASLQGIVSRYSTQQIYVHPESGGYQTWLEDLEQTHGIGHTEVSDPWSLVDRFLPYVRGYLLFAAGDSSINAATSLAGVEDALAVEAGIEGMMQLRALDRIADLRGVDEAWVVANHGDRLNPFVAFEQRELFPVQLRDYAVLAEGLTFFDGNSSFREDVVGGLEPDGVVFGWGDATMGENVFVGSSTERGVFTVAADHAHNLAPLSGIPTDALEQGTRATVAAEAGVHHATFILTDGDNVQWLLGSFQDSSSWFGSPDRGSFDMGYGIAPSLVDLAPSVLRWYYANAAKGPGRDFFLVGPSGAGYFYPSLYPRRALEAHVDRLARWMGLADLDAVQILDFESFDRVDLWDLYTAKPEIGALVYLEYADYAAKAGDLGWSNGKPVLSPRVKRWGSLPNSDAGTVIDVLNEGARDPTSPLGYSIVTVAAWNHSLSEVKTMIEALDPGVRVVTPGELFQLVTDNVPHDVAVRHDYTGDEFETPQMTLVGSAHWIADRDSLFAPYPDRLRLTNNGASQNGAAWYPSPIDPSRSWTATYRFQISHLVGGGADGFAFQVQGDGPGANPGYLGGFASRSLSVVVDTWDNGEGTEESLKVLQDGEQIWFDDLTAPASGPSPGSSSTVFRIELSYVASEGRLRIRLVDEGGFDSLDGDVAVDLSDMGAAYAGFAATTGASAQNHDIRSFRLFAAAP